MKDTQIIDIFCAFDEFYKEFHHFLAQHSLEGSVKKRNRVSVMSISEVMTIMVLFHMSNYREFKHFYLQHVCVHLRHLFPQVVSYNRMVELQSKAALPMAVFLKMYQMGTCSGISFIDSTPLEVCHNRRIHQHKVFKGLAQRGHSSKGWFYGFKLHLVHNDSGQVIDFQLTPGNVHDNAVLKCKRFMKKVYGKLFGDKGYIVHKAIFDTLFLRGIHLITKLRRNMKTKLITPLEDALLLRKRAISETIIDQLKNISQIEHSRHRSFTNFFVNLVAGLCAYQFKEKKPSIYKDLVDTKQLFIA
jgi:hypothetical protein